MLAASQPRSRNSGGGAVASVNLVAKRCHESLQDRSAATLLEQRTHLPGFVLLDREDVSLAGHAAVRTLFTYPLDGFQIVVDQWLIVERGWAWCLSGGTDTIGFPGDAAMLASIAGTLELPTREIAGVHIHDPSGADAQQAFEADTNAEARPLAGAASDLLALVEDAARLNAPKPRSAATRAALEEAGGFAPGELATVIDELLEPVRAHTCRLELQVDEDLVLGWIAGDATTLLAPGGPELAILRRMPTATLPVALVAYIPSLPRARARSGEEPFDVAPGVLATVIATATAPVGTAPGPGREALPALARGLRAWWRLETGERDGETCAHAIEGLHSDGGPWRVVAHHQLVRVEPVRPREVFGALCEQLLGNRVCPGH